jgi:bacteriorhodopsin
METTGDAGKAGLAIGFVCMFGTATGIFVHALRQRRSKAFSAVSFLVCVIAATSYLSMAAGATAYSSTVSSDEGRTLFWARYADWLFTTPLLLIDLGLLAGLTISEIAIACGWSALAHPSLFLIKKVMSLHSLTRPSLSRC